MKKVLIAAALLSAAPSAQAATILFAEGNGMISPGQTLVNDFNLGGVATVVPVGMNFILQTGSNGNGAQPAFGDGSRYLSVLGGGTASFTFANAVSSFGFDLGSADDYNNLVVRLVGGGNQAFSGTDIINSGVADGNQSAPRTNGRVTVLGGVGESFTGFTITSGQNSAEIDNLAVTSAVPEPSTWAMMLIGFGAIGYSMRRRTNTIRLAQAA
jgi:hypothetical protein